ncbi:MAG TPA: NAD(P)/FAD-dependent oxidoreductase [Amycolatopsis sp.]|jgi:geranylgeranyl reductase family protein|nr:NAD(P)/FAD-dependent oxidoreductase [Amycolatopsis sp.]
MSATRRGDVDCDVLIVGAGPAGSGLAAALCRARPGLDVVVADRAAFPRDKPCGDGISPRAALLLHEMGAGAVVAGYPPNDGCCIVGPDRTMMRSQGIPSRHGGLIAGYTIPRTVLDHRLLEHAVCAGARFWPDTRFVETALDDAARSTTLRNGSESVLVRSRLLVGCDGAYSGVRRALGVTKPPRSATAVAARAYLEWSTPDAALRPLRFVFRPRLLPAYGWLFPISATTANIGVGLSMAGGPELRGAVRDFLAELVAGDSTFDVPPRALRGHLLPHAADRPPLALDRAALVGDAASMINPVSGEGIYYALCAGLMLTEHIAAVDLADGAALGRALSAYQRAFRSRFAKHYRSARIARRVASSERLCVASIRAAAANERSTRDAASLLFGDGSTGLADAARLIMSATRNAIR